MNKKDLKNLAQETAARTVDPEKVAVFSRDDFRAAVQAVAKEFAEQYKLNAAESSKTVSACPSRVRDQLWWEMYRGIVGAQVGGLMGLISNADRFEGRLKILGDMAQAAVNFAIKRGKVAKS